MAEEIHEIEWTTVKTHRSAFTRKDIEDRAEARIPTTPELMTACRRWLAANPKGLTREQFYALPDGSVVESEYGTQLIKIGERGGYTNGDSKVRWVSLMDHDLRGMTVASTPPEPERPLDDATFVLNDDGIWFRCDPDGWRRENLVGQLTSAELIDRGPLTILVPGPQIVGEKS